MEQPQLKKGVLRFLGHDLGSSIAQLDQYKNVKGIIFQTAFEISDLSPLLQCRKLEAIHIGGSRKQIDLSALSELKALKHVSIQCKTKDYTPLFEMTQLENLVIRSMPIELACELHRLNQLKNLRLHLGGCKSGTAELPGLPSLKYLELWQVKGLKQIEFTGKCPKLHMLFLDRIKHLTDLSFLASLPALKHLHIEGSPLGDQINAGKNVLKGIKGLTATPKMNPHGRDEFGSAQQRMDYRATLFKPSTVGLKSEMYY